MQKVDISQKLEQIHTHWDPHIVASLNGQEVKLAKFKGEFPWHQHDNEDEMFLVLKGNFTMEFRDKKVFLTENEFLVVPRGTEHRPVAAEEVSVMLFEPAGTLNTGNTVNEFTKNELSSL